MSDQGIFGDSVTAKRIKRPEEYARAMGEPALQQTADEVQLAYRLFWSVNVNGPRLGAGSVRVEKQSNGQMLVHSKRYCLGHSIADTPSIEERRFECNGPIFEQLGELLEEANFWNAPADDSTMGVDYWIFEVVKNGNHHLIFRGYDLATLFHFAFDEETRRKRADKLVYVEKDIPFGVIAWGMLKIAGMSSFEALSAHAKEESEPR